MEGLWERIQESVDWLRPRMPFPPRVCVILGSGLGGSHYKLDSLVEIPYREIPHFPRSTAPGHEGTLIWGSLAGFPVALLQGRFHYYEGYSTAQITIPVRVISALGAKVLIVTNAAGGLNPLYHPGDIMGIMDHIHLIPDNPLRGLLDERLGERFPDMSRAYDPVLLDIAQQVAIKEGIAWHKGVYVSVPGPSLETPAETRFLRLAGADAVGMSTTAEVIVARSLGLRVLGLSIISNVNRPDCMAPILVEDILECSRKSASKLAVLLTGVIQRIPSLMD